MPASTTHTIKTLRFAAPVPYAEAYALQLERRNAIESGEMNSALLLLEHTPTFTLGRRSDQQNLLATREALAEAGIEVCETDRGGDVTYHGPGQLVAYPILDLSQWRRSIPWYLRALEDVIIQTLDRYGLKGERIEELTGVWVDGAKVAAIGIGIHNWVTFHGVAINLDPNMDHWRMIVPCGIPDKPVTSLAALLPRPPTMDELMQRFEACFRDVFDARSLT